MALSGALLVTIFILYSTTNIVPSPMGVCNTGGIANTLMSHKGTGTWVTNAGTQHKFSKIVLPPKLRYLENMLNADVIAKAAKIRQRIEENPNIQDSEKSWPLILAKYEADENLLKNKYNNNISPYAYNSIYSRRFPNYM